MILKCVVTDKLVEGEAYSEEAPIAPKQEPDEDYEYDIKEKLKEMGEISFETVKKGEKPKKAEVSTENEVVVTPAKKPGKQLNKCYFCTCNFINSSNCIIL